jgi:apolipoprotein N-acyltransferase
LKRLAAAALATGLSAVLYALAFPATSWRALAWIALVPFLLALRAVGTRTALALAWVWTIAASSLVADALPGAVETYFLQPALASALFATFVWTVTGALYYMGFAWAYRALAARVAPIAMPLLGAAAWTAGEFARGRLPNGTELFAANPWALVAYSQVGWDTVVQIAAVTGVYGISFAIAAVNAGLAEVVWALARGSAALRSAVAGACLALFPALAVLGYGWIALRDAPPPDADAGVPVALVQPNLVVGSQWRSDTYGAHLEEQLQLTLDAARNGSPRTAFWPESALTFFLENEPAYQRAIGAVLAHLDLELVLGGPRASDLDAPDPDYFNTVFLMDPSGAIRARYDKRQLVPFAEFLPLRRFDFLRRRFERVRAFRHGAPSPPLPTRAGPAGVLVCNEAMYPEMARERVLEGAAYLVNPSNDTWIQSAVWAERMLDLVSLRAVEQRRHLVRASTSGPSAIVDPWGRVQRRSESFAPAVLHGFVAPREERSVYARIGDAFAWACVAAVAAGIAFGARGQRHSLTTRARPPS